MPANMTCLSSFRKKLRRKTGYTYASESAAEQKRGKIEHFKNQASK